MEEWKEDGWRRRMEDGEVPAGIWGWIFPAVFQSHPKVAELPSAAGWALGCSSIRGEERYSRETIICLAKQPELCRQRERSESKLASTNYKCASAGIFRSLQICNSL